MRVVRLTEDDVNKIKSVIHAVDPDAEIILFGSRVVSGTKGGDIDLLIVSSKIGYRERRKIRVMVTPNPELGVTKISCIGHLVTGRQMMCSVGKYSQYRNAFQGVVFHLLQLCIHHLSEQCT